MSSDEEHDSVQESEVSDADDYSSEAEDRDTDAKPDGDANNEENDDGKEVTWQDLVRIENVAEIWHCIIVFNFRVSSILYAPHAQT